MHWERWVWRRVDTTEALPCCQRHRAAVCCRSLGLVGGGWAEGHGLCCCAWEWCCFVRELQQSITVGAAAQKRSHCAALLNCFQVHNDLQKVGWSV